MSGKYQDLNFNYQQVGIHETLKVEQFKSIFNSLVNLTVKLESNYSDFRSLTLSKLIITLDEDIYFKLNPSIDVRYKDHGSQILKVTFKTLDKEKGNKFNSASFKNCINGFDDTCRTVEFTSELGTQLYKLLPYLDGKYTVKDIAEQFSISEKEVLHFLQPLYEIGFLILCSKSLVPASSFYTHLMNIERSYRVKSLKQIDTVEKDDSEHLKHFLVQNLFALYHYVSAFPEHLGEAISHISNQELKEKLCNVVTRNYWHSNMLLKGLMALGYSKEQVKQMIPTPATLGVINYLRGLAKTDLLSYAACLGLTEYIPKSLRKLLTRYLTTSAKNGIVSSF